MPEHAALALRPTRVRLGTTALVRLALLGVLLGNLGRLPGLRSDVKSAPILAVDLAAALLAGAGALLAFARGRLWLDRAALAGLAFAAVGALSAVAAVERFGLSAGEVLFSLAYLARWLLHFGVYVVVLNQVAADERAGVLRAVQGTLVAIAGFGLVQAALLPGFAQLVYPDSIPYVDWDPQGHRLVSTLLDPNFAGALVAVGLLLDLGAAAAGVAVPRWRPLLLFAALAATASVCCGGWPPCCCSPPSRRPGC